MAQQESVPLESERFPRTEENSSEVPHVLLPVFLVAIAAFALWLPQRLRPLVALLLPLLCLALAWQAEAAGWRLFYASAWLLYALKGSILLLRPAPEVAAMSRLGLALYLTVWPGMDPEPLGRRNVEVSLQGRWFVQGWITMLVGVVGLFAMPLFKLDNPWLGILGLATTVHLGYSDVLSALVRWLGFPVHRLFDNPLAANRLRDFWSHRWNRPFVEMNKVLFLPLLQKKLSRKTAVTGAFIISGILHELAISLPVKAGWGGPLLYFVIQAVGMRLQKRDSRLFTWLWLLVPAPILFHDPFREGLITPLLEQIAKAPMLSDPSACVSTLLWLAGCGHFLVLAASFQVPHRLGWHKELQLLRPLNRKLLWVYGGFIVGMITSFGALILKLHPLMLAGETGALYLLGLIAVFWTARLVVDAIVFEHDDWPQGPEFIVGHTMLTSLFVFITGICWWVVLSHLR